MTERNNRNLGFGSTAAMTLGGLPPATNKKPPLGASPLDTPIADTPAPSPIDEAISPFAVDPERPGAPPQDTGPKGVERNADRDNIGVTVPAPLGTGGPPGSGAPRPLASGQTLPTIDLPTPQTPDGAPPVAPRLSPVPRMPTANDAAVRAAGDAAEMDIRRRQGRRSTFLTTARPRARPTLARAPQTSPYARRTLG